MIKKIKNCFIGLGIMFIMIGVSIISYKKINFIINEYNADIEKSKEIITIVNSDYNSFNKVVVQYKDDIVLISKSLDIYYEDFFAKNAEILEKIENLKLELNNIGNYAKRMTINCQYDLNNLVMTQQCGNFSINYKSMVDAYSNMIVEYNKVVEKYNEYALSNGKETVSLYNDSKEEEFYIIYNSL